jgi:hypothetical protein
MQGVTAKARTVYHASKDADPNIPLLKAAKAGYEKLK